MPTGIPSSWALNEAGPRALPSVSEGIPYQCCKFRLRTHLLAMPEEPPPVSEAFLISFVNCAWDHTLPVPEDDMRHHHRKAIKDDGYTIVQKASLISSPVPTANDDPKFRTTFVAVEAPLTCIFGAFHFSLRQKIKTIQLLAHYAINPRLLLYRLPTHNQTPKREVIFDLIPPNSQTCP